MKMLMNGRCWWLLSLLLLFLRPTLGLRVRSEFNQRGVSGSIEFSQDGPTDNTTITVNLTGLSLHDDTLFQWHVHQYPFPLNGLPTPCGVAITGGHYDPLGANSDQNYTQNCAQDPNNCEIGDLSGKFGLLNISQSDTVTAQYIDSTLSLHGVYSIIGRSIVVHLSSGTRLVCANIDYPQDTDTAQSDILISSFRSQFTGYVHFRGHTDSNTSSVYTNLLRVAGSSTSTGHNWHVHEFPLDVNGTDCSIAGPHYNPLNVNVSSSDYSTLCNPTSQENCEIGDLSNKGSPYSVVDRVAKQFYTDISLPLAGDMLYIVNRSVVIHQEDRGGPRISCANLTRFTPLEAVVNFNENGIIGNIRFSQLSLFDPTFVTLDLRGLAGMAGGYHVHVLPVPPEGPQRCSLALGHWNPTGVVYNTSVTRPLTSDEYEIGDLSGKFGGLGGLSESMATYSDPNVPLFGLYSIVGRSVVIHRTNGSRVACANIELIRPVLRVVVSVNTSSLRGQIIFTQPADNPFSETTITVELEILQMINVTTPTPSPTPTSTNIPSMTQLSVEVTNSQPLSPSPSVSAIMTQPDATSTVGAASSFQTVFPSQTVQSIPVFSSSVDVGSGDSMLPFGPTTAAAVAPTTSISPTPIARRRRALNSRTRRQAMGGVVGFDWSVRMVSQDSLVDCSSLPVFGEAAPSDPALCSPTAPLACSAGDLTGKHGSLSLPSTPGPFSAVFTDPSLPLSGPRSPFTTQAAVLVQQMGVAAEMASCSLAGMVEMPPPMTTEPPPDTTRPLTETTPTMQTTAPPPAPATADAVLIGAVVGGVLGALLLVGVVILLVCCCYCKSQKSEYKVSKQAALEMGTVRPAKPILGVPQYRALHNYAPQNPDDLELEQGVWVTLLETPAGGGWWKGQVEEGGEGWFPRTYVEYVDIEAEKKRQQDENFLMAASAIVAASTSFNAQHPSLTQTRHQTLPSKSRRALSFSKKKEEKIDLEKLQRSHTMSRKIDIDSTPRAPRKLDRPYLDTFNNDENGEATIIPNEGGEVVSNGALPDTPVSQRNVAFYANVTAIEGSPQSQRASEPEYENGGLDTDKYIAKHDFNGSTDIELELKKGELVTIVEKSDGGWWKGVCEGRVGWFPQSYVRPAPMEARESMSATQPANMEEMMKTGGDLEAVEYCSIFPYQSDTEGDLVFAEGDTVLVYWAQDNGWWYGAVGSTQGWFPGSFIEPLIESPEPQDDKRKEGRSSFKKMWSLRKKSRDKSKDGSLLEEDNDEKLPTASEAVGLEGQLQAALERRRSFGRTRNLAVDEEVAKGGREKGRGGMGAVADFMRRSFKKTKSREEPKYEEEIIRIDESSSTTKPQEEVVPKPATPPSKSPRKRLDSTARRAPPPPPPAATQSEPLTDETRKEEPSPTKAEDTKPPTPMPQIHKAEDTKPPTPTPQIRKASTAEKEAKTTRSFSTAQPNSTQPKSLPRKRLTTTAGGTQRRQPPPPPSAAKVATPPVTPSHQATPSVIASTSTNAEEVRAPTNKVKIPPVPPRSLLRPRVQRVKRPISRMIPPPPNIPLPPPPIRKAAKIEETVPTLNNSKKRMSIDKPAVAPKPAHLRRYSTPTLLPTAQANTEPLKSPKPKPPPPMRTSSLATRPVPPVRKVSAPSQLPKIKDESEEVDSPQEIAENTLNDKAARSAPPRRPPPPRPPSAASGKINKIGEEDPSVASAVPAGDRVLYSSPDAQPDDKDGRGHSLRSKGSNLMQSLKKMVTRDSKKGPEKKSSAAVPVSSGATKTREATDITATKQDSPGTKPARPPPPKSSPTQQKRDSVPSRPHPPSIGIEKETRPTPAPRQSEPDPPQPKAAPRQSQSDLPKPMPVPRQESDPPQPMPAPRKSEPDPPQPMPAPRKSESDPPQLMPNGEEEMKPTPVPRLVEAPSQDTKPTPLPRQRSVSPQDQSTASPDLGVQVSTSSSDANFYRATMRYEAKNDKELSFSKGDVLIIVQKQDDGFHYGMLDDGTTGLFPLHAVEPFLS